MMPSSFRRNLTASILLAGLCSFSHTAAASQVDAMARLGKHIFNNDKLSRPIGQSCASCHSPETGFTSPDSAINDGGAVVHGAMKRRAGNRKPPSSAYATFATNFEVTFGSRGAAAAGGTFYDGRATGEQITAAIFPDSWDQATVALFSDYLGPAVDQAAGPFMNPVEQNVLKDRGLCLRLRVTMPLGLWDKAWGEPLLCHGKHYEDVLERMAFAVGVYEASAEVNAFSSIFDRRSAKKTFDTNPFKEGNRRYRGYELWKDNCASFCHTGTVVVDGVERELFARPDASYANIGIPRNDRNPFYKMDRVRDNDHNIINPLAGAYVDYGVGGRADLPSEALPDLIGKFKAPTLRNVAKKPSADFVKAYGHNGYFKSLESIVHFYNTRDLKPTCEEAMGLPYDPENPFVLSDAEAMFLNCWPQAEVGDNIFQCNDGDNCKVVLAEGETPAQYCANGGDRDIGNLCLTPREEKALIKFLETLSDR